MFAFLHKPFPGSGFTKKTVLSNFLIGCFIAAFLIIFQPFEINLWVTENKILKLAGFGLVSFLAPLTVVAIQYTVFSKRITEDSWTVWKEIIAIIMVIIFVALGNLFYGNLLGIFPMSLNGFFGIFISTVLIGFFPVTLHVILKQNRLSKRNEKHANVINEQLNQEKPEHSTKEINPEPMPVEPVIEPKLIFVSENEKDKIELYPLQLLFIESADNYSNIVYHEDSNLKKQMIRSSLKRLESQYSSNYILRCHRTFIVNLKNVKSIEGNAAGY